MLFIGIVLAIVLPLTLRKKPIPVKPTGDFYNPYVLDPKSVKVLPSKTTGIIKVVSEYSPEQHSEAFNRVLSNLKDGHPLKKGINSTAIPMGLNN